MKRSMLSAVALLLFANAAAHAQGPRGPRNPHPANAPGNTLNMAQLQIFKGEVSSVAIGYGLQYPSITVRETVGEKEKVIKVAPVWYLLENDFELKTGDQVTVTAVPSVLPKDTYLYAVDITRDDSDGKDQKIVLRDTNGVPAWTSPAANRGGRAGAPRHGGARGGRAGGCLDPSSAVTVKGVIAGLSMGVGMQMPTLILAGDTGVSMRIGPERVLLEADFEMKLGDTIEARYVHESCTGGNVALQLTKSGVTVTLRGDDGSPNWQ